MDLDRPSTSPQFRAGVLADGLTDDDIRSRHARAEWRRIRPGAYLGTAEWETLDDEQRHRLLIAATVPKLAAGVAVSHQSAVISYGLPATTTLDRFVHISRPGFGGGFRRGNVHCHSTYSETLDHSLIGGIPLTLPARTVLDIARTVPLDPAICVADAALHRGLVTTAELSDELGLLGRRHGVARASAVTRLADGSSESVGESLSRMYLRRHEVPSAVTQFSVMDGATLIGRTDFAWPEHRTLGEFDGRVKYGRLLKPGETAADVIWREKLREDALRQLGWEVVRWVWADLFAGLALATRLRVAFERAARR